MILLKSLTKTLIISITIKISFYTYPAIKAHITLAYVLLMENVLNQNLALLDKINEILFYIDPISMKIIILLSVKNKVLKFYIFSANFIKISLYNTIPLSYKQFKAFLFLIHNKEKCLINLI